MVQPQIRLPPHLQPRSKAAATSSSTTSLNALAAPASSTASRSSSRTRTGSPLPPGLGGSDSSVAATEALIRRTLCPYSYGNSSKPQPLDELLPPLTSSNDVDLQLYAVIAVVVKEFVYSWYGKITPDQTFVEEIIRIVAHCTRDLEQRLRRVDVVSLLLDEIPALVCNHVKAQKASRSPMHPSCLTSHPREIYHTLNPHPAFAPVPQADTESQQEQERNERYYRQLLVHGALAVLLPTEDLQSPPLRILVSDVFGEMILGKGIGKKACEGWVMWEGITKVIASTQSNVIDPKKTGEEIEAHTRSRLEKFGLLQQQKQQQGTNRRESNSTGTGKQGRSRRSSFLRASMVSEVFWRTLQYVYLAFVGLRFVISGLISASTTPPRSSNNNPSTKRARPKPKASANRGEKFEAAAGDGRNESPMTLGEEAPGVASAACKQPMLSYAVFGLASQLLDLPWRMPWLYGLLNLGHWQLTRPHGLLIGLGDTDAPLDKFLHALVAEQLLRPSLVPALFQQLRTAIFPNNALGPPREIPSLEEQKAIRRQAAEAILGVVPRAFAKRLFVATPAELARIRQAATKASLSEEDTAGRASSPSATSGRLSSAPAVANTPPSAEDEAMILEVEEILNVFEDSYMNKHLVFGIVELLFVRLLPEISEKGVRELLEERGVAV